MRTLATFRAAVVAAFIGGNTAAAIWLLIAVNSTPYQEWALASAISLVAGLLGLLPSMIKPLIDEQNYSARDFAVHGQAQAICWCVLTASWILTAGIWAAWSEQPGLGLDFALLGLFLGYASYHSLTWFRQNLLYHAERRQGTAD